MSSLTKDPNGRITRLRITDAMVQYTALVEPRDDRDLKPGTYGAQFIIRDEETIALIKEYTREIAAEAIRTEWKKKPYPIGKPYSKGSEDREAEAGGYILKTNSGFQPKLYIRRPGQRTIALDDNDEFYDGMIVDADVVFKAYNVTGNHGVTAYLQAVCKVGDGEPLYVSSASSFDVVDFEDDEASSFDEEPTPPKKKAPAKKAPVKEAVEDDLDLDLDDFDLDEDGEEEDEVDTSGMTLEDLLK